MKSFEKAIEKLSFGFVFTIKRDNLIYNGYLLKYDGDIFKDILLVDVGPILDQFPHIKKEINYGYSYYGFYDMEQQLYQSTIIKPEQKGKHKALLPEEILDDYQVFHKDFISSIIELDTKIANQNLERKHGHQKKLVS